MKSAIAKLDRIYHWNLNIMNKKNESEEEKKIRQKLLIKILLDPNEEDVGAKDDAALDLGEFQNDEVLDACIQAASNPNEDNGVVDLCGENIGSIWIKKNAFDLDLFKTLPPWARNGIMVSIDSSKPEWVEKYKLNELGLKKLTRKDVFKSNRKKRTDQ
jgi:hypothetical protein